MIEALVVKTERLAKGKSLKNMTYPRVFCDFTNCMAAVAPRAYRSFQDHFGGPKLRSLRQMRARSPRFQPGFSALNIAAAKAVITKFNYHGPLTLSWDDTALEEAIAIWQESKSSACVIVGGANGTIEVPSEDEFDVLFAEASKTKAKKVQVLPVVSLMTSSNADACTIQLRLWLLGIPLHKVPPIIVAAVARGTKDDTVALTDMHFQLMELLHSAHLYPVSHAADGTEVERTTQRSIEARASDFREYSVKTPIPTLHITTRIHYHNNHPFVSVQDSSHARKTARN